ncbi:O-antigen ligase family protein [Candidatus Uhrbacteria bacterium]|nr:O-antigen ligase family protein [Candidatus Uhrbacteria bacterium]
MTNRLARAFPYLLIAPAILPLIYVNGLVYPYVTTKTFLLQGIGIIAFATFAYLALSGQSFFYGRLRNKLSWIPAALLVVAYTASIFGIDFYRSFWGLFDRGDGLLTLTVVTVFFYLILLSADRIFYKRLIRTIATVAGIVAAIAVLQWVVTVFGTKVSFLPPTSGRIGSTFGNAAFLAGYLGIALFVTLIALRDATGLWRRVYGVAAVLSVFAVLFAATRGTILALTAAGAIALGYAAWRGEGQIRRRARYGLIALVAATGLFFVFRAELTNVPFEPVRRIASISLSDGTVSSRLFVWKNISAEALRRPFLGYGAEHVDQLFDKIYDPGSILEQWFDRSHNAFLDYFVQYGVFGLALYLALIVAFILSAFRMYRHEPPGVTSVGFLFLLLVLTYAIQNFFVFDTPSSLWLLYALLSLSIAATTEAPVVTPPQFTRWRRAVAVTTPFFIVLLIIPAVLLPLYANVMLTKGYLFHLIDVNRANTYFKRGLAFNTYADLEYGYQAYDIYTDRQTSQLSGSDRIAAYDYALSVLSTNFKKYPYDARTATYLGHVLDTAPPEVPVDNIFDEQVLARAIELSPLRAQAWYMTANIYLREANAFPAGSGERESYYREAIKILELYATKETKLPVPRYTLATLYYALDDHATAKKWADEALPLYVKEDSAAARPAIKYYLAVGDWQHAARFLANLVADDPSDNDVLYDLAKVSYLAGDPGAALRIVEELRVKNPALLETDHNFLAAITVYEQSQK